MFPWTRGNAVNKKTLGWILMALGVAVLGTGIVLRFGLHNTAVTFDAAALCLVGLSLSLDYRSEQYQTMLRIFQALSVLLLLANAVSWFVEFPHPVSVAIRLAAVGANLPLAALGLKKNEK